MKIKTILEFKKGAQALITGGSHVGSISKIKGMEITRSTKPNLVMYDEFQTIKTYSFVVGEKKAMVSLPEVKI
jgi:ribosomal protein S4E